MHSHLFSLLLIDFTNMPVKSEGIKMVLLKKIIHTLAGVWKSGLSIGSTDLNISRLNVEVVFLLVPLLS